MSCTNDRPCEALTLALGETLYFAPLFNTMGEYTRTLLLLKSVSVRSTAGTSLKFQLNYCPFCGEPVSERAR